LPGVSSTSIVAKIYAGTGGKSNNPIIDIKGSSAITKGKVFILSLIRIPAAAVDQNPCYHRALSIQLMKKQGLTNNKAQ
jgi:hypothetical protein